MIDFEPAFPNPQVKLGFKMELSFKLCLEVAEMDLEVAETNLEVARKQCWTFSHCFSNLQGAADASETRC